jgi:hypothetical protein
MFSKFDYEQLPLASISLDLQNPRLVREKPFATEDEIVEYLLEYEDLGTIIDLIASEGKNRGAEQPYVVATKGKKNHFTVIEGNRRIAAYKLLTGELTPPAEFEDEVPELSAEIKDTLRVVDCSIAPSRASLDKIMARAHFGRGEKERWKYLGSRQAIYRRWKAGEKIPHLARTFDITQSEVKDYILEYLLYLESLKLNWTDAEKERLQDPRLQFNPPVRFLQTAGHKEEIGILLDKTNLEVSFKDSEAKKKFRHLIDSYIVNPKDGLKATSGHNEVFARYGSGDEKDDGGKADAGDGGGAKNDPKDKGKTDKYSPKKYALFDYDVTVKSGLLIQLMDECGKLSANSYPAAATALLRSLIEALLKHKIDESKANEEGKRLSLESALDLCLSAKVKLSADDTKILKEFKKDHLDYVNMGVHGNVIPNRDRTLHARDSLDQFVKKHV